MARKTVLVIEDHPGDRHMYGDILWYNGFDVVFAEDGEAGLKLAQERKPDLILLDLELPLLHGLELASRLQQDDETKDIPVVALTGRRLSELGGNAEVLGYKKFLEKPVSPLAVLREVEQIIGRATPDPEDLPRRPEVHRSARDDVATTGESAPAGAAVGEDIISNVEAVLERWEQLVREEPWFSLPREHRVSNLAAVLQALTQSALHLPDERVASGQTVMAAVEHGSGRRAQGIPEALIPIEFHLLRQALWRYVSERFPPTEDIYALMHSYERAIGLALNAAMWGYFRGEIEAQGLWETAVERLIDSAGTAPSKQESSG